MVTKADQLAHLVDTLDGDPSDPPHNPIYPLVIGDIATNKYTNISYDPISGTIRILVVDGVSSSVLTFDSDGTLLLNGQSIADNSEFQVLLQQAQLASQQAQEAAAVANEAANLAVDKAEFVDTSVSEAQEAALQAAEFAFAPSGTTLPGGGNSAAVSAQIAGEIAQESRELQQSDPVVASEVFSSGFFDTERRVTTTSAITITLPAGLYTSTEKKSRWAAYKLAAASGSITAVAAGGGSGFVTPSIVKTQREQIRILSPSSISRNTISTVLVAVPAVTNGMLIAVLHALHNDATVLPTANVTCSVAGTIQTLKPVKTPSGQIAYPTSAVFMLPLASFAGGNITFNVDEGPYTYYQSLVCWVINGAGVATPVVTSSTEFVNQAQFNTTQVGLTAQSLVLVTAEQGINSSMIGAGFSSFSANLTKQFNGNTYGSPDVLVSDALNKANAAYAYGNGVAVSAGDFVSTANFATATGKGMITAISIPPLVGAGGDAVLKAEAGRTALTVPYGVMEIWAQPDGVTYEIRTSKP